MTIAPKNENIISPTNNALAFPLEEGRFHPEPCIPQDRADVSSDLLQDIYHHDPDDAIGHTNEMMDLQQILYREDLGAMIKTADEKDLQTVYELLSGDYLEDTPEIVSQRLDVFTQLMIWKPQFLRHFLDSLDESDNLDEVIQMADLINEVVTEPTPAFSAQQAAIIAFYEHRYEDPVFENLIEQLGLTELYQSARQENHRVRNLEEWTDPGPFGYINDTDYFYGLNSTSRSRMMRDYFPSQPPKIRHNYYKDTTIREIGDLICRSKATDTNESNLPT